MGDWLRWSDVIFDEFQINTVWVDCEGENPADTENIGAIKYYPHRGFPGYYFPFKNTEGYLSPLVAVNFEQPKRKITLLELVVWVESRSGWIRFGLLHAQSIYSVISLSVILLFTFMLVQSPASASYLETRTNLALVLQSRLQNSAKPRNILYLFCSCLINVQLKFSTIIHILNF